MDYVVRITVDVTVEADTDKHAEQEALSCVLEGLFDSVYKTEIIEERQKK